MHFSMSYSCQFHSENATEMCCSLPAYGVRAVGLILDNPAPSKPRPLKKKSQAATKCKCRGVSIVRKTSAKLGRRDPSPLCVSPLKYQSFFTVSFHDTLAGAHGSGSEVPMEVVGVFVFTVFQLTKCLS